MESGMQMHAAFSLFRILTLPTLLAIINKELIDIDSHWLF